MFLLHAERRTPYSVANNFVTKIIYIKNISLKLKRRAEWINYGFNKKSRRSCWVKRKTMQKNGIQQ